MLKTHGVKTAGSAERVLDLHNGGYLPTFASCVLTTLLNKKVLR